MAARGFVLRFAGALCVLLAGLVFAAGSAYAASAPVVKRVWASEVNRSTARINAAVNPEGSGTTYRFEYGPDASYGSSVPVPDGDLGSGSEVVEVAQLLTGLQAGSSYHYRIVATNPSGTSTGEDEMFTTFAAPVSQPADTCPNAVYRVGFSAGLPDCRAFEMVSPVNKNGGEVSGDSEELSQTVASEGGDRPGEADRVEYMSKTGFGATVGSGGFGYTQYLAERGPQGWATRGIMPTPSTSVGGQGTLGKTEVDEFTPDLGLGAVSGYSLPESPAGARPNSTNWYLEDTTTGRLTAAVTDASHEGEPAFPPSYPPFLVAIRGEPMLGGASSSLDVVTFMSPYNFVPEAHGMEDKAYVYEHGSVKLLGVLPDNMIPPGGSNIPPGGSTLVKYTESSSLLYDEEAVEEKDTVSSDGSRILFMVPEFPGQLFMRKDGSTSVLVSESETSQPVTAEEVHLEGASPDLKHIVFSTSTRLLDSAPQGGGLYMYTDSPNPQTESNLTYIGPYAAIVRANFHNVLGVSDDGTHIYYAVPTGIYLWDSGQTRQIFPAPNGIHSSLSGLTHMQAQVTPDGKEIAFMQGNEMYVYNEGTDGLKCVSCPPTGAAATVGVEPEARIVINAGGVTRVPHQPRFMTRDGRYVFFSTPDSLVPQDTNGLTDTYEYDTVAGRLSLLSTGTGESGVWFVDANADGHDVFVVTRQKLTGWDPDKLADLYDVRVEGGFAEPPAAGVPCAGDACQGTPAAVPAFNTASGFIGLGNPSFASSVKATKRAKPDKRLRRALAACRRKPRWERARCERLARKRYGTGRLAGNRRAGR